MDNELQEVLKESISNHSSLSQFGDNNVQIAHANNVTINYFSKTQSRINFTDKIDKDIGEFFVKTNLYTQAIEALEKENIVILIGQPGIGKTITSEMVAYDFSKKGYDILISEEGNISNAKTLLMEEPPQSNTLIILNDFLGQFYTSFKESDSSELNALFRFLKDHEHIKLLINTRGIIYREALENTKFEKTVHSNSNVVEIHMSNLTFVEKANILHCHMKRAFDKGILSNAYCLAVIQDRNYGKIALHENFVPRIAEHIISKSFITNTNSQNYVEKIFQTLENPSKIWKEEYEKLDKVDHILLNTIFSLTNTNVSVEILRSCFDNRIKVEKTDTTINHFNNSITRLTESLLKIDIYNGEKRVGVINPSINDFLFHHLSENNNEMESILKYAMYYEQIERLIPCKLSKKAVALRVKDKSLYQLTTFPKQVFSNISSDFAPPPYLYVLKIWLIYLDESDLSACGIRKEDIRDYVNYIFENMYDSIEANSRLYFAYEFPNIFEKLSKSENGFDLSNILKTEKYLKVVIDSISRCSDFWEILVDIQDNHYDSSGENFYCIPSVKSSIQEKLQSEVISDVHDDIVSLIKSEIDDNYDELEEYEDMYDLTDFILQGIEDDIRYQISDLINSKIVDHGMEDLISKDEFDIDSILSEDVDIHEMIESKYNELWYSRSEDYKKNLEEPLQAIVKLFEDTPWFY